jgi:O-antigen/teichoic acid export membrane protein
MTVDINNNKRIAKNTILLYIRMIAVMATGIYTSRVYLDQLGVSDYGIYNVVGGVVGMLSFFSSSMSTTSMRYITIALGEGNLERLKKTFAGVLNINIAFGLGIVILLETVGIWFVNYKLVIPDDRLLAANWVYQFSIISTFIGIVQIPYNSAINAHEDMGAFAWLAILDVIFKLGIAFLLSVSPIDKLIFYGLMLLMVNIVMISIYRMFCHKHYEECRFHLFMDRNLYKSMASFSGWYMFGGFANICREEGVNILLNLFFGPLINAARAVAILVSSAATGFMFNFLSAAYPQVTKYYASGEYHEMQSLVNKTLKFSFLLVFVISVPLMLNIDFVLAIWLKKVPAYADIFMILVCTDFLCKSVLGSPFGWMVAATGKVRNEQLLESVTLLLIIPVSYCLLLIWHNPLIPFIVVIVFNTVSGIIRLLFARNLAGYSVTSFYKDVLVPCISVVLLTVPLSLWLKSTHFAVESWANVALLSLSFVLLTILATWYAMLNGAERQMVVRCFLVVFNR